MRALPGGQSKEEVASVVMQVVASPLPSPSIIFHHLPSSSHRLPSPSITFHRLPVLMQVVASRQPDVFTKPGVKAELMQYFEALTADAQPSVAP